MIVDQHARAASSDRGGDPIAVVVAEADTPTGPGDDGDHLPVDVGDESPPGFRVDLGLVGGVQRLDPVHVVPPSI